MGSKKVKCSFFTKSRMCEVSLDRALGVKADPTESLSFLIFYMGNLCVYYYIFSCMCSFHYAVEVSNNHSRISHERFHLNYEWTEDRTRLEYVVCVLDNLVLEVNFPSHAITRLPQSNGKCLHVR
jgi:hypothetical protein